MDEMGPATVRADDEELFTKENCSQSNKYPPVERLLEGLARKEVLMDGLKRDRDDANFRLGEMEYNYVKDGRAIANIVEDIQVPMRALQVHAARLYERAHKFLLGPSQEFGLQDPPPEDADAQAVKDKEHEVSYSGDNPYYMGYLRGFEEGKAFVIMQQNEAMAVAAQAETDMKD